MTCLRHTVGKWQHQDPHHRLCQRPGFQVSFSSCHVSVCTLCVVPGFILLKKHLWSLDLSTKSSTPFLPQPLAQTSRLPHAPVLRGAFIPAISSCCCWPLCHRGPCVHLHALLQTWLWKVALDHLSQGCGLSRVRWMTPVVPR
jgi:hypothetical protein